MGPGVEEVVELRVGSRNAMRRVEALEALEGLSQSLQSCGHQCPVADSWHVVGVGIPENSAQCLARVAAIAIGGLKDEKVRDKLRTLRAAPEFSGALIQGYCMVILVFTLHRLQCRDHVQLTNPCFRQVR